MSNYEKRHVLDIIIDDEQRPEGRRVTVHVDTLEKVSIDLGGLTIRTDEEGVEELRDALHKALLALEQVRYERVSTLLEKATEDVNPPVRRELSDQQRVDIWDPNDPANW